MSARHNQHVLCRPFVFNSLTEGQIALLHEASLEIMARTGMRFYEQEALDLFKRADANVSDGNLVRIPPHLVEWALRTVPKNIIIYDQDGQRAMALGGYRSYFGVGSDCTYIYDPYTGERRKAMLDDVVKGVRLVDALPNLDFVMSMFLPADVPMETYERHQMAVMLRETRKPIVFVGLDAASTVDNVQMAMAVAGGLEPLQHYPFIINYVNPTSSFRHDQEGVQRLLFAAERNLPTIYEPGNARGTTSPMTVAGAMALGNAGQLAGLVLSQLKREGSPIIRTGNGGATFDMRWMIDSYNAPDGGTFGWDLAHHYGLPILSAGGFSDAKVFDAQAGAEAAMSLFASALSGANLITESGYLDCCMTGSLALVVFCDELIGWIRRYLRGHMEISEETLALDLIHEVGPDGDFLETEHTLRHCRDNWLPDLIDRRDYDKWATAGATTLQERANKKAWEILESHCSEPLSESVSKKIEAILEAAQSPEKSVKRGA